MYRHVQKVSRCAAVTDADPAVMVLGKKCRIEEVCWLITTHYLPYILELLKGWLVSVHWARAHPVHSPDISVKTPVIYWPRPNYDRKLKRYTVKINDFGWISRLTCKIAPYTNASQTFSCRSASYLKVRLINSSNHSEEVTTIKLWLLLSLIFKWRWRFFAMAPRVKSGKLMLITMRPS